MAKFCKQQEETEEEKAVESIISYVPASESEPGVGSVLVSRDNTKNTANTESTMVLQGGGAIAEEVAEIDVNTEIASAGVFYDPQQVGWTTGDTTQPAVSLLKTSHLLAGVGEVGRNTSKWLKVFIKEGATW